MVDLQLQQNRPTAKQRRLVINCRLRAIVFSCLQHCRFVNLLLFLEQYLSIFCPLLSMIATATYTWRKYKCYLILEYNFRWEVPHHTVWFISIDPCAYRGYTGRQETHRNSVSCDVNYVRSYYTFDLQMQIQQFCSSYSSYNLQTTTCLILSPKSRG